MKSADNFSVRKPAVAGIFYPADAGKLGEMVTNLLQTDGRIKQNVKALLVPHAGYIYSGATAGEGFASLDPKAYTRVILIGTAHHVAVSGAAMHDAASFETPLGAIAVDQKANAFLHGITPLFEMMPSAHEQEHSLEVQIPFIIKSLPSVKSIVPLLLNTEDYSVLTELGKALGELLKDDKTLLVISSDLAHYPPVEITRRMDNSLMLALAVAVKWHNPEYFSLAAAMLEQRREIGVDTVCCGQAALTAGMIAALAAGATEFRLIKYSNSADVAGADRHHAVGYAAGAFLCETVPPDYLKISDKDKKDLLSIARKTLESKLGGKPCLRPLSDNPLLNIPVAIFVTLTKNGELRGCIGNMEPHALLQDAVAALAISSAFEDPRFPPLAKDELDGIRIEISILTPLKRIKHPDEIIEGKHGVYIQKDYRSGTYLPQVWTHFDTKEKFMNSLCEEKAGLSRDAWLDPTAELYTYTVVSFEEDEK